MEFQMQIFLSFVLQIFCFLSSSLAYNFYVGGRDGWVLSPSESYSHWAERNRFQVNDTLVFNYKKGTDSVLFVNDDDYFNCNTKNPIMKMEQGDSEFKFDRSGPFFFITGNKQRCDKGQKLIVVVLAVRHHNHNKNYPPSPSPSSTMNTTSPIADSPTTPTAELNSPVPAPSRSPAWALTTTTTSLWVIFLSLALNVALSNALDAF